MQIQVKKISVPHLTSLIRKMLLMDTSVYLNVNNDRIWSDVYTPTKDVVKSNWISAKDAIHKISYYLKNDKERKLIAERGQKFVMKSHTYKHRLATILKLVSQKIYENKFSVAPIKNLNNHNLSLKYHHTVSI
jgi:hypothetical protein